MVKHFLRQWEFCLSVVLFALFWRAVLWAIASINKGERPIVEVIGTVVAMIFWGYITAGIHPYKAGPTLRKDRELTVAGGRPVRDKQSARFRATG